MRETKELKPVSLYDTACISSLAASARPADAPFRERLRVEGVGFLREGQEAGSAVEARRPVQSMGLSSPRSFITSGRARSFLKTSCSRISSR